MPVSYIYDPDKNIVYTRGYGEVNAEELQEYFESVLADEHIANGFWEVVNTEDTTNVVLTFKDCVALISPVRRFVSEKEYRGAVLYAPIKIAYYVSTLLFGILRSTLPIALHVSDTKNDFQELVRKYACEQFEFGDIDQHGKTIS